MYHYYCEMDESILADVQRYEDQQLAKFQREFGPLCLSASNSHGWNYTVSIHRWFDITDKLRSSPFDGYTATLQVDFADSNGNLIEIDETICSFFENITFISFIRPSCFILSIRCPPTPLCLRHRTPATYCRGAHTTGHTCI